MKIRNYIISILAFLIILSIIAGILGFWLGFVSSFRIIFGIIFVLFIPGFVWSYVFFEMRKSADSNTKNAEIKDTAIDWIERITLSIALSLALVPLTIFFLNKIGVKIDLLNVILEIFGVIILGIIIIFTKKYLRIKQKK